MLTNLSRDREHAFQSIAFFDAGTWFFEERQRIDGDELLRHYLSGVCQGETADSGAAGSSSGGTESHSLHGVPKSRRSKPPAIRLLALDPVAPCRQVTAETVVAWPQSRSASAAGEQAFECVVRCPEILVRRWAMLAFVRPHDMERLRTILAPAPAPGDGTAADAADPCQANPARHNTCTHFRQTKDAEGSARRDDRSENDAGFRAVGLSLMDAEDLLRLAFCDDNVRDNSLLATTLARLPLLFAKAAKPGHVQFRFDDVADLGVPEDGEHWLVAVIDTGASDKG